MNRRALPPFVVVAATFASFAVSVVARAADPSSSASEWRALGTVDGTTVSAKGTRVRAVRTLPIACEGVVATLTDVPAFKSWINVDTWTVVDDKRAAEQSGRATGPITVHGVHQMPFPFAARDYVVDYTTSTDAHGVFTLRAASVARGPAPANGAVRLRVLSTWTVTPPAKANVCDVSYEYDGDLGGSFPAFLLEGVWKDEGPKLMSALLAEAKRRAP